MYRNSNKEAPVIREILAYLKSNGVEAWRNYHTGHFNRNIALDGLVRVAVSLRAVFSRTPIETFRQRFDEALGKAFQPVEGSPKGQPDIFGAMPGGRLIAVEVKVGSDVLSAHQKGFISALRSKGVEVYVVESLHDFAAQYAQRRGWGAKTAV